MPSITVSTNNTGTLDKLLAKSTDKPQDQLKQPSGSNECGAYALTAALAAEEALPVTKDTPIEYGANKETITSADTYKQVAKDKIYKLTGILNPAPSVGNETVPSGGYNSPAALAKVALDLGRTVKINVTSTGFAGLKYMYPGEEGRCIAVVKDINVNTAATYVDPGMNEVHLICVQAGAGLHWIARGSDGKYYDSGDGSVGNDWGKPETNKQLPYNSSYVFTGLWIAISK